MPLPLPENERTAAELGKKLEEGTRWLLPTLETLSGPGTQMCAHGGAMGKSRLCWVSWVCDTAASVMAFQSYFGEELFILSNLRIIDLSSTYFTACV